MTVGWLVAGFVVVAAVSAISCVIAILRDGMDERREDRRQWDDYWWRGGQP